MRQRLGKNFRMSGSFLGIARAAYTWMKYMGAVVATTSALTHSSARAGQHKERADVLLSLPLLNLRKF